MISAPMGDEMRLWQVRNPGPLSQTLTLTTAPRPSRDVEKGKVLVEVAVVGLNPADYKLAEAGLVARLQLPFPKTLGTDFSGTVIAVGSDITDIKPGDNVLGRMFPFNSAGSLSEYVVASYDDVAVISKSVTFEQAAGAPTVAQTAYQTLAPVVKAGDKVFINGGSGGTGTFCIQIAKALGCHVTVSCSTTKVALCRELGADEVIDYKKTDIMAALQSGGNKYAVAIDNVGNLNLFGSADRFLLPGGLFRLVGAPSSFSTAWNLGYNLLASQYFPAFLNGSKNTFNAYVTKNSHDDLAQIAALMAEGKVRTVVDSVFQFSDVLKAYQRLGTRFSTGKVLVHVRGNLGL
ncbi:unnamed protein product [Clonostachys byssicola]|uniref:Enoyl reductase (ER) domain-containing protein n=1 Tax=Clonostachys byssicola TaxID=160290 RepID=A0A9N9U124_9HYPO|nr:unnamed protein product [Clonostachys byssicola]